MKAWKESFWFWLCQCAFRLHCYAAARWREMQPEDTHRKRN